MNPFRNRPFLFCGLILYTLLLTAALLYFRFPTDDFKVFCQNKLSQLLPETQCTIGDFRYKFPLGMEVENIHFKDKQKTEQILFTIDQAVIRPKLTSALSQFHVNLTAYDGKHDFSVLVNKSEQTFDLNDIHLSQLNLAEIPFLGQTFKREITGSLSGNATYHATWNKNKAMHNAQGNIQIEKGSFGLLFPILSLKKIDLSNFKMDFSLQNDRIQVKSGSFQGRELRGEFEGDTTLQTPFRRSEFAINGILEPLPPLLKKSKYAQNMVTQLKKQHNRATLPYLLQGTVQRPRFKFGTL